MTPSCALRLPTTSTLATRSASGGPERVAQRRHAACPVPSRTACPSDGRKSVPVSIAQRPGVFCNRIFSSREKAVSLRGPRFWVSPAPLSYCRRCFSPAAHKYGPGPGWARLRSTALEDRSNGFLLLTRAISTIGEGTPAAW